MMAMAAKSLLSMIVSISCPLTRIASYPDHSKIFKSTLSAKRAVDPPLQLERDIDP